MSDLAVTRTTRLELDVDTRLGALWAEVPAGADLDLLAPFMRAAYGIGYVEALRERNRGQMCRENGYEIPTRRT